MTHLLSTMTSGRRGRSILAASVLIAGSLVASLGGVAEAATAASPSGTVTLSSGSVVSADPTARTKAQEASYRLDVTKALVSGKLSSADAKRLHLEVVGTQGSRPVQAAAVSPTTAHVNPSVVHPNACDSDPTGGTSPSNMTAYAPVITRNVSSQGEIYYSTAKWKWKSSPQSVSTCSQNVGGRDGFGITMSDSTVNKGTSLVTCNSVNKCSSSLGSLNANSQYGASYTFQDKTDFYDGNTYTGTMTYSFVPKKSGCIQSFSKYGHTWNETAVNGFGVGEWSFSISWSTSSSHWELASAAGSYSC